MREKKTEIKNDNNYITKILCKMCDAFAHQN